MAARRGKHLHKEGRVLLLNVFDYFTREKGRGGPLQSVFAVQRRTSEVLQASTSTVEGVLHSKRNIMDLETPPRKRAKPKCEDIPDYLKQRIKTMIYTMYENKEVVTLDSLLKKMEVNGINNIGRTTLSKLLKHLEFKYKITDNRRSLCELSDVVTKRNAFLRRYIQNLNCSSLEQKLKPTNKTTVLQGAGTERKTRLGAVLSPSVSSPEPEISDNVAESSSPAKDVARVDEILLIGAGTERKTRLGAVLSPSVSSPEPEISDNVAESSSPAKDVARVDEILLIGAGTERKTRLGAVLSPSVSSPEPEISDNVAESSSPAKDVARVDEILLIGSAFV
ncbi:hypothetical protein FQA39_LY09975 [Lamprigera yunnana]|nr:hypothetical protein FQA39_LY09975 [Lamprigera yunnana]